eukprot:CAMPEP_0184869812 /NCGR_PEP_ID=MMETSP0580-20130426/35405_1 /TAXON_ID=1118495 /ORGANISM="Dactyliosolen fragilissimus" /LENGTH=463 /DNA_ID=CAMNT_0027371547 /DNA_START=39 /DNA_END=1427 /DNA_ORIENTATION=+
MPLLTVGDNDHDTIDVADIGDERAYNMPQHGMSSKVIESMSIHSNTEHSFVDLDCPPNHEDVSVMTFDSTFQNVGNNDWNSPKFARVHERGSFLKFSKSNVTSSSSSTRQKVKDDGKDQRPTKRFSTQTYSSAGTRPSYLHSKFKNDNLDNSTSQSKASIERHDSILPSLQKTQMSMISISRIEQINNANASDSSKREAMTNSSQSRNNNVQDANSNVPSIYLSQHSSNGILNNNASSENQDMVIAKLKYELASTRAQIDHANLKLQKCQQKNLVLNHSLQESQLQTLMLKSQLQDMEKLYFAQKQPRSSSSRDGINTLSKNAATELLPNKNVYSANTRQGKHVQSVTPLPELKESKEENDCSSIGASHRTDISKNNSGTVATMAGGTDSTIESTSMNRNSSSNNSVRETKSFNENCDAPDDLTNYTPWDNHHRNHGHMSTQYDQERYELGSQKTGNRWKDAW